jgi:hypothetical protein
MRKWSIFAKIFLLIVMSLIIVCFTNLPFLPGPSSLFRFAHFVYNGSSLISIFIILLMPFGVVWLVVELIRKKTLKLVPMVSVLVSVFAFFNVVVFADLLRGFSRRHTIVEALPLIESIEKYRTQNGVYPDSLSELTPEYLTKIPEPSIIGINRFVYAKKDDVFELRFYQNVSLNFNVEVVIYNPKGEQKAYGEMPTLYSAGTGNWKYFIFD